MFTLTKTYAGISCKLDENQQWEGNHLDSLIFFLSLEKIKSYIEELGFKESASINSHGLDMGFDITVRKELLFVKTVKNNSSYIVVNQSENSNALGGLQGFNLDKKSKVMINKICDESVKNKYKNHKCFGISGGMGGAQIVLKKHIGKPDPINFAIDYGYGFDKVNNKIIDLISNRDNQLLIFEGEPGTGKTSYIRHLFNVVDKNFLFSSAGNFNYLEEDSLMRFTSLCGPLIIVVEDSEELVTNRGFNNNLGKLLNLIDGVHKKDLPLSFILTWNAKDSDIDPALKRKGRLSYRHKFDLLPPALANEKAKELKIDKIWDEPTSLTEIYNAYDELGYQDNKKKLGF